MWKSCMQVYDSRFEKVYFINWQCLLKREHTDCDIDCDAFGHNPPLYYRCNVPLLQAYVTHIY